MKHTFFILCSQLLLMFQFAKVLFAIELALEVIFETIPSWIEKYLIELLSKYLKYHQKRR